MFEDAEEDEKEGLLATVLQLEMSFAAVFMLSNFLLGFINFVELVLLDLFTNFDNQSPGKVSELMSIVAIPRSFGFLYGLSSDNIKLFGSHRKSHFLVNIVFIIGILSVVMSFRYMTIPYLTGAFFVLSLNASYLDAICDSLAIQKSHQLSGKGGAARIQAIAFGS